MSLLQCRYVGFNGSDFGYVRTYVEIEDFNGTIPIDHLNVYPLGFHSDPQAIKEKLECRGLKALNYQDISFRNYVGMAEGTNRNLPPRDADSDLDLEDDKKVLSNVSCLS